MLYFPFFHHLFCFLKGTKNRRLIERHAIDAYPSVILYVDGDLDHPVQYTDVRDPDHMVQWVNEQVEKLAAGENRQEGFFAAPLRPKYVRFPCNTYLRLFFLSFNYFPGWVRITSLIVPSVYYSKFRWRIRKVLFRVGDVVKQTVTIGEEQKERKGVVLGWDYKAKAPQEWLNARDSSDLSQPHYMYVLFNGMWSGWGNKKGNGQNYIC